MPSSADLGAESTFHRFTVVLFVETTPVLQHWKAAFLRQEIVLKLFAQPLKMSYLRCCWPLDNMHNLLKSYLIKKSRDKSNYVWVILLFNRPHFNQSSIKLFSYIRPSAQCKCRRHIARKQFEILKSVSSMKMIYMPYRVGWGKSLHLKIKTFP